MGCVTGADEELLQVLHSTLRVLTPQSAPLHSTLLAPVLDSTLLYLYKCSTPLYCTCTNAPLHSTLLVPVLHSILLVQVFLPSVTVSLWVMHL